MDDLFVSLYKTIIDNDGNNSLEARSAQQFLEIKSYQSSEDVTSNIIRFQLQTIANTSAEQNYTLSRSIDT